MRSAVSAGSIFGLPHLAEEIVSSVQEPFALLDAGLRLAAASPAFYLRFGLEQARSVGRSIFDLGSGEWDTPAARELFERLAPRREVVERYPVEVRCGGGSSARVELSVRPVREGLNVVGCYLVSFADVAPELGSDELDAIRKVRVGGGDLVLVLEPRTLRVLHVEGAARELTGYAGPQLEGVPFGSLLHQEDREQALTTLAMLTPGEPHRRISFRIRNRGLKQLWVEALCARTAKAAGPQLIHVVARDISERKRAEEALRWLGRQTKLILDSAADGIFGVDRSGTITFINPAAARALGYRVPDLLGRSHRILIADDTTVAGFADLVSRTLEDGLGRTLADGVLRCVDGSEFPVEATCNPAREMGCVVGAVVTFRGIAERKRAEAAARRAEWLAGVGETTLALRHEINTPITTLLAEAHLLEMGGNTPEEERQMIQSICAEARRIAAVMRTLAERQDAPRVRVEGTQRMLDLR